MTSKNFISRFSLIFFFSLLFFSCSSDDDSTTDNNEEGEGVNGMVALVSRVIQDSGLEFPEPSSPSDRSQSRPFEFLWPAEDYVSVEVDDNDGYGEIITVKIYLGPDNHMIPTPEWQSAHPDYCSDQGKYMRPARKMLQFTIFNMPIDDIRSVQLNYVDVETFRIEHSLMTEFYDHDPNWMYEAMSEVWDEMLIRATIKGAVEPCEDRIPLKLYFESTISVVEATGETYEKYEFTVDLHFDEETGAYKGSGDIVLTDGWIYINETNEYYPPQAGSGTFEVTSLYTPWMEDNPYGESPTMDFTLPTPSGGFYGTIFIVSGEIFEIVGSGNNTAIFRIHDWQLLDDEDLIMGAYSNTEKVINDALLSENTIIEIGYR